MIRDSILYTVMLFVIAVALVIIFVAYDNIATAITQQGLIDASISADFETGKDNFSSTWDYTFLTVFIGVLIGVIIISYVLATNPVYFFIFIFIVVILGGLAGYLANAFSEIILDPVLGASAANFPIMSFILENYLLFIVVTVMLMVITFFAKPQEAGF